MSLLLPEALKPLINDDVQPPPADEPVLRWWRRPATRNWFVVGLLFAILVGLKIVGSSTARAPYDPDSTRPRGTKAFVELMQQAGSQVVQDNHVVGHVAMLFNDTLTAKETKDVEAWVEQGGTLIVSDPYSSFQMGSFSSDFMMVPSLLEPHCSAFYMSGVSHISPDRKASELFFENDLEADKQCFPTDKKAYFLQERVVGDGRIIGLGGSEIFTNERLGKNDNSVLVTNLARPDAASPLTILETRDVTGDDNKTSQTSPISLFSEPFKDGLWMAFAAVIVYMMWRGRRLGRPIDEQPLVRIPASQLIVATGDLLELANQSRAAAAMLRDDFRRSLADRFGVRFDIEPDVLAELVGQRTGIDTQRIRSALRDEFVVNAESLVVYAQHIERLQQEVKHVR